MDGGFLLCAIGREDESTTVRLCFEHALRAPLRRRRTLHARAQLMLWC